MIWYYYLSKTNYGEEKSIYEKIPEVGEDKEGEDAFEHTHTIRWGPHWFLFRKYRLGISSFLLLT